MFLSDAYAQTAGSPAAADPTSAMFTQIGMMLVIFLIFYFLLLRPQQRRVKAHQEMIAGVKRGDVVVTAGGLIGKVKSVADDELRVELAPNVEVRVVRGTISDVRAKTEPAPANDSTAS